MDLAKSCTSRLFSHYNLITSLSDSVCEEGESCPRGMSDDKEPGESRMTGLHMELARRAGCLHVCSCDSGGLPCLLPGGCIPMIDLGGAEHEVKWTALASEVE